MNDEMISVQLTKSQCANVADFIEFGLIQHIKDDPDLDNIRWIADIIEAWKTLEKAGGGGND